jgi:hypothetical protein
MLIDSEVALSLCFSRVGMSDRFCIEPRRPGYSFCRTKTHAETRSGSTKFCPTIGHYYPSRGLVSGNKMAQTALSIAANRISLCFQAKFVEGVLSPLWWIALIKEAVQEAERDDASDADSG